jgi:hypothetical protein
LQTTVVVHFENLSFCHLYLENDEKIWCIGFRAAPLARWCSGSQDPTEKVRACLRTWPDGPAAPSTCKSACLRAKAHQRAELLWQPAQKKTVLPPKPIHFGH